MWYRYYITVPRGTEKTAPSRKEIVLPEGVIIRVDCRFPPGPRGHVFTAVFEGVHKMWPRGEGNWAWGDDETIRMKTHVRNIEGFHWILQGYAPDTSYDHTIWWDFNVLEKEYAETWHPVQQLVELLKKVIGL